MADVRDATARLEELLSPRGRELLDRLKREAVTPDTALRVSVRLRADYPAELVARHRARRYPDTEHVADLCCGIGGDLIALAASRAVLAVDHDRLHLRMARANAEAYGVADRVSTVLADVRDVDLTGVGAVFIDPARRTGRGRLRAGDS